MEAVRDITAAPTSPWRPHYEALGEGGKLLYRQISRSLCAHETLIGLDTEAAAQAYALPPDDPESLHAILKAVHAEIPEDAHTSLSVVARRGVLGRRVPQRIEVEYADEAASAARDRARMERRVGEVLEGIPAPVRAHDHLVALYLHDWLASHCAYATGAPFAHNAAGALVYGRAVCEGIARAYKLLCDRAGICCGILCGSNADSPQGHAWNIVRVGGLWAHVDVTDDLVDKRGAAGAEVGDRRPSRAYFGLSDAEIERGRTCTTHGVEHPACTHNLGYYESCELAAASAQELEAIVRRQIDRGARGFEIKCTGELATGDGMIRLGSPAGQTVINTLTSCGIAGCTLVACGMDVVGVRDIQTGQRGRAPAALDAFLHTRSEARTRGAS